MSAEILIVDDNADIRNIINELIVDAGYKTRIAANYNQALSEIDKKLPDVAILDVKLKYLEEWTEARRAAADKYVERLTGVDGVFLPHVTQNVRHVYHLFVIQVENRDATLKYLNENAIGAGIHYPIPLHKQPAYAKLGYNKQSLPHTETAADKIVSLPMFPEITDQQIDRVVQTLKEALDKC